MTTINTGDLSLLDLVRRQDPDGSPARIIELLSKRNPILRDAVAKEGNTQTGHRFTTRNTEPALGWRRFNAGISPSKSTTTQYDETCGMLQGYSRVDEDLANLNGNAAAYRMSEDMAFLSAMNKEAARALMYSSVDDNPEEIHGLSTRYDLLTKQGVVNGATYTGAVASGNEQSSIWMVVWGDDASYLIYPKGMTGGLTSKDMGLQIVDEGAVAAATPTGKLFNAWVTHWKWNLGLCVQDRRQIVRICNLDSSTIGTDVTKMTGIIDALVAGYYRLNDPNQGRLGIYCNRPVAEYLHRGAASRASSQLTLETFAGKPVTAFLGHPISVVDALIATEAPIV